MSRLPYIIALTLVCCAAGLDAADKGDPSPAAPATQPAVVVDGGAVVAEGDTEPAVPDTTEEAFKELRSWRKGRDRSALDFIAVAVASADGDQRSPLVAQLREAVTDRRATGDARRFACSQLGRVGTPEAIKALEKALGDGETFHAARVALIDIPDPQAGKILRKGLSSANTTRLVGYVDAVAARRDAEAVDALGRLINHSSGAVSSASVAALARVGGVSADAALARAEKRGPVPLRPAISQARLRCAKGMLADGDVDAAMATCHDVALGNGPRVIRRAALTGMVQTRPARAAPVLAGLLTSRDPALAELADRFARQLPGPEVTAALGSVMADLSAAGQRALIDVLLARADPAARPAIITAARASDASTRLAAVKALGTLGDATVVVLLAERAAGNDAAEADAARDSLRKLQGRTIDQAIAWALKDAKSPVRVELVRGLAARKATWTVPDLINATTDRDKDVRAEVFAALGELAGPEFLDTLILRLGKTKDSTVRAAAEEAVYRCAARAAPEGHGATRVLSAMRKAKKIDDKASLLRVVGRLGGPGALTAARQARKSKNNRLRSVAVEALAAWPDDAALDDLIQIVKTDKNTDNHAVALGGYLRIAQRRRQEDSDTALEMYRTALELARRLQDKRAVLAALGDWPQLDVFQAVAANLSDRPLRAAAAESLVRIAPDICKRHRCEVTEVLQTVVKQNASSEATTAARSILVGLAASSGHILSWQYCGPFSAVDQGPDALFDMPFAPEGAGIAPQWKPILAGADTSRPWAVDLDREIQDPKNCVVYLRTRIHSATEQTVRLETGSDDGLKVWLNDKQVVSANSRRRTTVAQDTEDVTLNQGWNTLLMKVTQGDGDFSACARFRTAKGEPVTGLLERAD